MMKAMVYRGGDLGNAFEVKEIKRPIPKEHQILVKVNYSSLNNVDYERFKGKKLSLFARATLLFGGKGKILGGEVSGQVEAVGEQVQNFKKGDKVFGQTLGFMAFGAWAEYALLEEKQTVLKPSYLSYEEAAVLASASKTAIGALCTGQLQSGQSVLIYGASGGVGHLLVCYAKALGASITGVCSQRNLKMATDLGCDRVIDYQHDDFEKAAGKDDLILAVNGHVDLKILKAHLKKDGILVGVGASYLPASFLQSFFSKRVRYFSYFLKPRAAYYNEMQMLVMKKEIKPFIDKVYPITQVSQAIQYVMNEHPQGKIALRMHF